ncbi:hypothetical protein ACIGXM_27835 [Kitasatospora sp. NPDC052896]|uniref:hypothetical protein n=1 Tax=Kitasatospora sp. NPDC052896 TaxID=3364061 RepID=UPI0037C6CB78
MSAHPLCRAARVAAIAALAVTSTVSGAGTATAASPEEHPVLLSVNRAGIQAPDSHQGGLVSFRVQTDDPNGRQLQLLRPHDGVSMDQVLRDLADSVSSTPSTAAAGIRAVHGEAEALGGAMVTRQVHEQFTEEVSPGAVYLVDLTALRADPAHPVVKTLNLAGTSGQNANQIRYPDGMVIQQSTEEGPRFQTGTMDHAHLAYLVHNSSGQIQEMELRPVVAGTTDDQVQQYLDEVADGENPASPFTGPGVGLGGLSPDHQAAVQAHGLTPGDYVVLSEVPDETTGMPQAVLGMHKVVTLQ